MGYNNQIQRFFKKICIDACSPKIRLFSIQKWNKIFPKDKINGFISGRCDTRGIIAVRYSHLGNTKEMKDTIWHEIIHILMPSKRHWYVECAAQKLARNSRRGCWSKMYHKSMRDVPKVETLLRILRKSAARFNRKH